MADYKKKVCMLGAVGVGKTSLVRQIVTGCFSDRYLATIGVKIDTKVMSLGPHRLSMVVWDLAGMEACESFKIPGYVMGASGFFIVADGTSPRTFAVARDLVRMAEDLAGTQPRALILNKIDLAEHWQLSAEAEDAMAAGAIALVKTSAKTGQQVQEAFASLGAAMLPRGERYAREPA